MSHDSLADLLEAFASAGELARVRVEVDADLEIAEITSRTVHEDGPALLFERVQGRQHAVVTNLFGAARRICLALGVESFEQFVERVAGLVQHGGKTSWLDRLGGRAGEAPLERFAPKAVKVAASQQVVKLGRDVDLHTLPALRCGTSDAHPAITAATLFTVDPQTGQSRGERCPLAVVEGDRLAAILDPYGFASRQLAAARAADHKLPVALILGGGPESMLLPDLPLAGAGDALAVAGLLSESPLKAAPCRTQPLVIPAEAEMIIEGEIDPAAPSVELGGIASPSGFYTIPRPAPAIEVTAITHRANAAFPAIVYGRPPTESNAVDRLAERLLLPTIQALAEEIVDLALPAFGGRSFVVVAIDKSYPQQAHKTAAAVWGCPALMTARTVVVVDRGVDVHDTQAVMFRVAANGRGGVDVAFPQGPAAPFDHAGGKLLIDATAKLPGEHAERWPDEIVCDEATRAVVEQRWQEYGLG